MKDMEAVIEESGNRRFLRLKRHLRIREVEDRIKYHLELVRNAEQEFKVGCRNCLGHQPLSSVPPLFSQMVTLIDLHKTVVKLLPPPPLDVPDCDDMQVCFEP